MELITVTVNTQYELDDIPMDFIGQIIIDGGDQCAPIVVNRQYYIQPIAIRHSCVVLEEYAKLTAKDETTIWVADYAKLKADGNVTIFAKKNAKITAIGKCLIVATDIVRVTAFGECDLKLWDKARAKTRGNCKVMNFGKSQSYLYQNSEALLMTDKAKAYEQDRSKAIRIRCWRLQNTITANIVKDKRSVRK